MIEVPAAAAAMIFGLLPLVGLGAYAWGWWLRGRIDRIRTTTHTSRPMTAEEKAIFDEAFKHMNRGFETMRKIFP